MILNRFAVDPDRLKIVILSTPKTGNTWLGWLLHYAYGIRIVEPLEWAPGWADDLPPGFVTHQHLFPSESLVRWLVESQAVALTTVRHPADTFLSYFHYVKWCGAGSDPSAAMLKQDGDRPGEYALNYINYVFPQIYAYSRAWAKLGSHVIRYEDLLADPLSQLREITSKILPLDEERLKTAVLLCKPKLLTSVVDPRLLRTQTAGRGVHELPSEIVDAMASNQAYASVCKTYGYDWSRSAPEPSGYDYNKIDPFRGHDRFDNGELISPTLLKIYLQKVPDATARWPEPWVTEGASFWNWLRAPSEMASLNPDVPVGTLTNIMMVIHNLRADLQLAYKNPAGSDRMDFATWFLNTAPSEIAIPWGLIEPVLQSFCSYFSSVSALGRMSADGTPSPPVLCVQPGQEISVNDISGRRGFHEFETSGGFAWLAASQTGLIAFLAPPKMLRLQMTFYCVTDRFPAEELEVTLNGSHLTHRVAPIEGNWVSLETEPFRPNEKLNVLTLSPPYAIPARFLHPASKDDRYLSVALAKLVFLEEDGLPTKSDSGSDPTASPSTANT
jgi:Sulfotransferase domain